MPQNHIVRVVIQTWVMVKDDIEKVLVPPGDIEFIFLEKGHQHFLPSQWNCCHVILKAQNILINVTVPVLSVKNCKYAESEGFGKELQQ